MKKVITLLLAVAFMAISANADVTINVRTTTGDAPYLYTWGGASNGEWPGTLMDETQTSITEDGLVWLTQEFDCDVINIIFNDGGLDDEGTGAIQTDNILGVTGTAYFIFDPEEGEYEDVTGTYVEIHEFDPSTLPAGVVFVEGKEFAYFVAPTTWTKCNVWAWNETTGTNFTQAGPNGWPGDPITLIGNTTDGNPVYQWIGPDIVANDRPEGVIFNNGSGTQTSDLDYVAGGVYDISGKLLYTVPGSGDEPIPGDVDGDGHVTSGDVTALYNYMLNSDDSSIVNGDQDGDGHITSGDVTTVYNLMLGNGASVSITGDKWCAIEHVESYVHYPIYTTDFDYMEIQFYTNGTGSMWFYDAYGYWGAYGFEWVDYGSNIKISYYDGGQDTFYYELNSEYLYLSRNPNMYRFTVFQH